MSDLSTSTNAGQTISLVLPTLSVQDSLPLVVSLTIREMEMLYAMADGLSNKEIAYRFGLTEGTVKSYVFNLYGKLGAKRRAQAIARARDRGLLV